MLPTRTPQPGGYTSAGSLGTEPQAYRLPEPWEGASGNARQLFYGIPKATCQVTSGVTSGIVAPLKCFPAGQVFGRLMAFSISHSRPVRGLPLLFGTPQPGALGRSRRHTDWEGASGNARQLFYGIPKATCQVTSGVTSGIVAPLKCFPAGQFLDD